MSKGTQFISKITQAGQSQAAVPKVIGLDGSVVSRELNRNADGCSRIYCFELACRKAAERQQGNRKRACYSQVVQAFMEEKLRLKYSLVRIVGLVEQDGLPCVSREKIYQRT